jgi:hypothetical protein
MSFGKGVTVPAHIGACVKSATLIVRHSRCALWAAGVPDCPRSSCLAGRYAILTSGWSAEFVTQVQDAHMFSLEPRTNRLYVAVQQKVGSGSLRLYDPEPAATLPQDQDPVSWPRPTVLTLPRRHPFRHNGSGHSAPQRRGAERRQPDDRAGSANCRAAPGRDRPAVG